MESSYTIQQIEVLSDIKAHTLRIWEKRYAIISPKRSEGNFRFYDEKDLKKILNISFLNKNGIKISKIAKLEDEDIEQQVLDIFNHTKDYDNSFQLLTKALIDYDLPVFEDYFNNYLKSHSFEDCLFQIIYPFFDKIGILWQTNKICPAQEHLFSQFVKQLVLAKINNLSVKPTKEKVLLYLRDNEYHELGLLVYHYFLKQKGYIVYNLGQSVPTENLDQVYKKITPKYVLTSFVAYMNEENFTEYICKVKPIFSNSTFCVSGSALFIKNLSSHDNIRIIKNLNDLKEKF